MRWIKLSTDIFHNEKIKYILSQDFGGDMFVLWIKMLILAAQNNKNGRVMNDNIPRNIDTLAKILDTKTEILEKSLQTFSKLSMIKRHRSGNVLIKNWEKYQNYRDLETIKKQDKIRAKNYRDKKRESREASRRLSRDVGVLEEEERSRKNLKPFKSIQDKEEEKEKQEHISLHNELSFLCFDQFKTKPKDIPEIKSGTTDTEVMVGEAIFEPYETLELYKTKYVEIMGKQYLNSLNEDVTALIIIFFACDYSIGKVNHYLVGYINLSALTDYSWTGGGKLRHLANNFTLLTTEINARAKKSEREPVPFRARDAKEYY